MGRKSTKKNKTVYQIAREELGLSRAEATDYIPNNPDYPGMSGISESMLVKMESGTTAINPCDVIAMAKRYNKPELRNYYCCHDCEIGKIDTPKVAYENDIHKVLVNMVVSLRTVNHNKIRLMEILQDETVSPDEMEDFRKIADELERISMTIEALQLWCEKKKIHIE